jgi:hypothetical protein
MSEFSQKAIKLNTAIDENVIWLFFHQEMLDVAIDEGSLASTVYHRSEIEERTQLFYTLFRRLQRMCGVIKEGSITDADIEAARTYPIEDLTGNPTRGWVRCPFHNDKTPSMQIKNNKAYCYGACKKTWGPIEYLMQKENISFTEAVKRLLR